MWAAWTGITGPTAASTRYIPLRQRSAFCGVPASSHYAIRSATFLKARSALVPLAGPVRTKGEASAGGGLLVVAGNPAGQIVGVLTNAQFERAGPPPRTLNKGMAAPPQILIPPTPFV